jgi:hypothetical protein
MAVLVGKPRGRPRTISIARLRSASHSRASLSASANSAKTGVDGAELDVVSKGLSKALQLLLGRLAQPEASHRAIKLSSRRLWNIATGMVNKA